MDQAKNEEGTEERKKKRGKRGGKMEKVCNEEIVKREKRAEEVTRGREGNEVEEREVVMKRQMLKRNRLLGGGDGMTRKANERRRRVSNSRSTSLKKTDMTG